MTLQLKVHSYKLTLTSCLNSDTYQQTSAVHDTTAHSSNQSTLPAQFTFQHPSLKNRSYDLSFFNVEKLDVT